MPRRDDPALRALVGRVLWPGFLGRTPPDWLRRELDAGLAGVVLFAHNLGDEGERRGLADALHAGRDDVLVGIDEEGGNVTRLEAGSGSTLPGAWQLGVLDDVALTEAVGRELARRSRAVGANVVLAPVADVNVDPANPVIGVRSFGADAALVSRHVAAEVRGIRSAGAAACAKHYPGHGDTRVDSHHALPVLTASEADLVGVHLPPFEAAIAAGVDAIMTGHLVVSAWGEAPATLDAAVLGRLRTAGFQGVIVTDALDMAAVRATVGAGPGAVAALRAGADLLCIGNPANPAGAGGGGRAAGGDEDDLVEVRDAVLDALADGSLEVAAVERAAERVAALGARVGWGGAGPDASGPKAAGSVASGRVASGRDASRWAPHAGDDGEPGVDAVRAARAAREAIVVRGSVAGAVAVAGAAADVVVLDARRRPTIAVDGSGDYVASTLAGRGGTVHRAVVDGAGEVGGEASGIVDALGPPPGDARTGVVVLVDALAASPAQRALVERVAAARPDAVVVHVGVPAEDADDLGLPVIEAFAASRLAADAVADLLRPAR